MEQMKFEQGDLQQEAPKRIKKRQPPRRRLRALAVVAAAVLAVVAAFCFASRLSAAATFALVFWKSFRICFWSCA